MCLWKVVFVEWPVFDVGTRESGPAGTCGLRHVCVGTRLLQEGCFITQKRLAVGSPSSPSELYYFVWLTEITTGIADFSAVASLMWLDFCVAAHLKHLDNQDKGQIYDSLFRFF